MTGRDGDKRAQVGALMELYGDQVMRLCLVSLRDWHLAQDACQETFFRAWKHYDRFRFESSEKTWLMRIAVNVCRDMQKARWYRQGRDALPLPDTAAHGQEEHFPGPVTETVLSLPEKYRLPLLLFYVHGMKGHEIARVLGISYPAVLTRLKRGRELTRQRMEEGGAKE